MSGIVDTAMPMLEPFVAFLLDQVNSKWECMCMQFAVLWTKKSIFWSNWCGFYFHVSHLENKLSFSLHIATWYGRELSI